MLGVLGHSNVGTSGLGVGTLGGSGGAFFDSLDGCRVCGSRFGVGGCELVLGGAACRRLLEGCGQVVLVGSNGGLGSVGVLNHDVVLGGDFLVEFSTTEGNRR